MFTPTGVPQQTPRAIKQTFADLHAQAVERLNSITDTNEKAQFTLAMSDWFRLQYEGFRLDAPGAGQGAAA